MYNNLQCFKVSQITQWGKICPCNFWPNIKHYTVIILTIEQRTRLCHSILFRVLWQSIWLTLWFGTNFVMQWSKLPDWTWQCFLSTSVFNLRKIWKNKYSLSFALQLVCFDGRCILKGNANSCILLNTV